MKVSRKTWSSVFERDRGHCRYCGADLLSSVPAFCAATVDPVQFGAGGGPATVDNLVLACAGCASLLSSVGHLRTFEERKAHLEQQHRKGRPWYLEFRIKLRQRDSAGPDS